MPSVKKSQTTKPKTSPPTINEPLWLDPPAPELWRFDFGKFAFGLFLVIIGLLYLAKNSGWLPLDFQFSLWQLWPMLLIFFGLSFVSGKGWTGLLTGSIFTLTVLVIAGIFISHRISFNLDPELSNPNLRGHLPSQSPDHIQAINIDRLSTSDLANLKITHDLGVLNISSGSNDKLITGSLASNYAKLLINAQSGAKSQSVKLSSLTTKSRSQSANNQLDLQLASSLPLNLAIDSGASSLNLDLSELVIKHLQVSSLGSDVNLNLNNANGNKALNFSGAFGTFNLNLAPNTALKITAPAVSNLELPNFQSLDDNTLATPDYDNVSSTINLSLDTLPDQIIVNWQ